MHGFDLVSDVRAYAVPLVTRFRGIDVREGILLKGPVGWGEFSPFPDYADPECVPWLAAAVEAATLGWPPAVRDRVPVNCIVPSVDPAAAFSLTAGSGCRTAKVKVADHPDSLAEDLARLAAVRAALGAAGSIRCDANGRWDVATAVAVIPLLAEAAGGLEYVEQPCRTLAELAEVRQKVDVPVAADESIRRAEDPLRVAVAGAADVAVIKCSPLGGVRRALKVALACGLPCVVSSAVETSVGLAAQVALAGALPELDLACGLGTMSLLGGDVVERSLLPVDGHLPVPAAPPDPSAELLERYAVTGPRLAWWLARLERVAALA